MDTNSVLKEVESLLKLVVKENILSGMPMDQAIIKMSDALRDIQINMVRGIYEL
jgi:hypothetical protein